MTTAEATRVATEFSPIDELHDLVLEDMAATDRVIHDRMESAVSLIPNLSGHLINSGGKRLRPMLTLAAAKLCGYRGDKHIKLAAAVEFIHTATLLHDDVVDTSSLRRGKLAANVVWGNKPSILVGDYLFSRAFQLMVEGGSLPVLDVLAGASAVIAEGEVLQLKSANNLSTTEDEYLRVIIAKTATLFAASGQAGAMLAGADPGDAEALRSYGYNLGIAFQLIDDVLDYSGRQAQMGKSVGDDFREAKVTLPVILAFQNADEDAKTFWRRTIQNGPQHEVDLQRAIAYIENSGAMAEAHARARHYAQQAISSLDRFSQSRIRDVLIGVADFCVSREA